VGERAKIMLHSIQRRYGEKLRASDGEIGHVRDFYFDDKNWTVRYLVADTGRWLPGRLVLISPRALGDVNPDGKVLLVNLTRQQIEDSPSIDEHKPVSRQQEEEYHRHYGYPYYAESWPLWGLAGYPVVAPPPPLTEAKQQGVDSHLRSARVVNSYSVESNDGPVGDVADFMINGRIWVIREIVVECGNWYSGKKVIVSADKVSRISYHQSTVFIDSTKAAIMEASEQA
jgi:PRC-barrel domain